MSKPSFSILILHGFTANPDTVRFLEPPVKALGIPYRMPVLRGHGVASPEALRGVTWPEWVEDGTLALNELASKSEKVIVVGHSMGGLTAINLAADHPEKIDSLILVATPVRLVNPLAPGNPFGFLIPVVRRLFKNWNFPPEFADRTLIGNNPNYPWAPMDAVLSLLDFTGKTKDRLPMIKTPTLILQSRKDTTVVPESANLLYSGISTPPEQKRIVWFEKSDHEVFRDCERKEFTEAIMAYIRERIGVDQVESVPITSEG